MPNEEKKSELRDGGGGGEVSGAAVTGREGGVNQEMGELKMSFLLGFFCADLMASSDARTRGEAAVDESKTGSRG